MTTPPQLLSVVLPAFDVAPFVTQAVRSVHAQDWPRLELVAVDDGSTDGTGAILDALAADWTGGGRRMVVRHQANAGAAAARNVGLDLAQGGLVAFLDGDDRWHPGLASRLAGALASDPSIEIAIPRWRYVDASGAPEGIWSDAHPRRHGLRDLMGDNPIHSATGVMLPRTSVERAGRFDPGMTGCIDLDFWTRAVTPGHASIASVPDALADYRRRPGQITGDWRRMERNWTRLAGKLAARGEGLDAAALSRARARACVYWSAIAYRSGDHAAARRLIAETWRRDPAHAMRDPHARVRSLAGLATLLPAGLHQTVRARVAGRSAHSCDPDGGEASSEP